MFPWTCKIASAWDVPIFLFKICGRPRLTVQISFWPDSTIWEQATGESLRRAKLPGLGGTLPTKYILWTPCLMIMRNAFFPFFSVSWYFFWLKKLIFVKNYGIRCSWLHFRGGQSYPNWAKVTPIKPENLSSTPRIFPKCLKLGLVEDIMLIYYSKVEIDDILISQPF